MPPTPVIADVFRIVMLWDSAKGISPRNVFHLHGPGRTVAQVGTSINAAFVLADAAGNNWDAMSTYWGCTAISIQPLDGATAATDFTLTTGSQVGGVGGDFFAAACAVVSLKTGFLGARGRGRVYVGPVAEGAQTEGKITAASQGVMLAGWGAFLTKLTTDLNPLCIASYRWEDSHDVTSVRIDTVLGTQRRRQDQLR